MIKSNLNRTGKKNDHVVNMVVETGFNLDLGPRQSGPSNAHLTVGSFAHYSSDPKQRYKDELVHIVIGDEGFALDSEK